MISEESSSVDEKDIILKNNLDHTVFSWSKQKGINPLNIDRAKGVYLYESIQRKF